MSPRGLFDEPPLRAAGFAAVAVDRAIDQFPDGLTYLIPETMADLAVGERVRVPLGGGNRATDGYVISRQSDPPEIEVDRIKPILKRDDLATALPTSLIDLARWISGYYCCPIGVTLASMLPAAVRKQTGVVRHRMIDLAEPAPNEKHGRMSPQQRAVLEALNSSKIPRPIEMRELASHAGVKTTAPIRSLVRKGYLVVENRSSVEAAWREHALDAREPAQLTQAQAMAVECITKSIAGGGFSRHLLFGVTGSGKTEVYIRIIKDTLARGKVALVLVPEISLTPQTAGRLLGRFPNERVAILHSGLTAAQRNQQWTLVRSGEAHIIIGARSAIFAPIDDADLGLIIVDEEHDHSYKQDQAPRYHGRDVAIRRAQTAQCPIIAGSATPALETWHNATHPDSLWHVHRLPERVAGLRMPPVQVVDLAEERRRRPPDRQVHLLGPTLETAIARTLDTGGQILLLLNRRGYANYITCPDHRCGWLMTCDECDVTMVYHVQRDLPRGGYVRCHHCDAQQRLPEQCPMCGKRVNTFGLGTQRVEHELERKFPQLESGNTLLRLDSDTMHSAAHFHDALSRFGCGEVRMLLGTQMISKGLDFAGVRLVGVVNADTAINLPDFRASERTFQLVSQVSGRTGRAAPGQVIVQTFQPDLPPIALAARHDYESFASAELADRAAAGLPPVTRMARIIVRDEQLPQCVERATTVTRGLCEIAADFAIDVRGPAPCAIARIAGRHRQQILLVGSTAAAIQQVLRDARDQGLIASGASMVIDVDPMTVI